MRSRRFSSHIVGFRVAGKPFPSDLRGFRCTVLLTCGALIFAGSDVRSSQACYLSSCLCSSLNTETKPSTTQLCEAGENAPWFAGEAPASRE